MTVSTSVLQPFRQARTCFDDRAPTGKAEWLTQPDLLRALGPFDLDPCAPVSRPWDTADEHFTILDNGLLKTWHGRVWCNPPYGRMAGEFLRRMAAHGNGVALLFARTETAMFHEHVWGGADAVLFLRGRLRFFNVDGTPGRETAGAPSCLVAYGADNVAALERSGLAGHLVRIRKED